MNETLRKAYELFAAIPYSGDIRHSRFVMSEDTAREAKRDIPTYIDGPVRVGATLLGLPVVIDNTMPFGEMRLERDEK